MYRNILLPIDLADPDGQRKAARAAADLADRYGARLHVMTVVPDVGMPIVGLFFPADFEEQSKAAAERELAAFVDDVIDDGVDLNVVVSHGSIYREIIREARETGSELIVMASHSPKARDHLIGPNAVEVVTHSQRSVLIVRDQDSLG